MSLIRDLRLEWTGIGCLVLALVLAGCAATRSPRQAAEKHGFLGDYSQLRRGADNEPDFVYIREDVAWSKYDAIIFESIQFWRTTKTEHLTQEERDSVGSACYEAFETELSKDLKFVEQPGPGVLRLRIALTEVKGANVPGQVITGIIPQVRALAMLGGMAADQATFVAEATGEAELVDSQTGERLVAGVDERWGTKSHATMFSTWADVQKTCEFWVNPRFPRHWSWWYAFPLAGPCRLPL